MDFLDDLLNFFYPERNICKICGRILAKDVYLCENCQNKIKINRYPTCKICGRVLGKGLKIDICSNCNNKKPSFDCAFSSFVYTDIIKEVIHGYKFSDRYDFYKVLASYMVDTFIEKDINVDYITWVPMHKVRKKERGYNQAELLAREMAKHLNIKAVPLLKRIKNTKAQSLLKRDDRLKNLKGAIICTSKVDGKSILLIDDVFTTGATAEECSKVLKNSGVKKIYVQTLATAKMH
jgi:ComF family protein